MFNELLFIAESVIVSFFALAAVFIGSGCLFSFISLCWIMGNLFVLKEVSMFGLNVITSDVFAVGTDLGITLLREYYGQKQAKKAVWVGIFGALFFLIATQFLLWYIPSPTDLTHPNFSILFARMPRIIISSLTVAAISKSLNLYTFNFITELYPTRSFQFKTIVSLCLAQFVDTLLFAFFALYGTTTSLWSIIFFSYTIKCIAICMTMPIVSLFHQHIKIPKEQ